MSSTCLSPPSISTSMCVVTIIAVCRLISALSVSEKLVYFYEHVRKEQSSPTIELRASAIKHQLWCCLSLKCRLPRAVPHRFTALAGFTVVCSYRISLGNTKDEGLKKLWRDLSSKKANFLNQ